MIKLTKNQKKIAASYKLDRLYSFKEASKLIKETSYVKFDPSIDIAIRLGIDPKKPDQMVRGTVFLPHGRGKNTRVLALVSSDKEEEAKQAGVDYVGLDEYLEKIKNGWLEFDVIVTLPSIMIKLGPLARILGPKGLMPNPKTGTVTQNIGNTIKEIKAGKISFKVDRYGIIHSAIAKGSFDVLKIEENASSFIQEVIKLKPSSAKGIYIKSIYLSSTMGPGFSIDPQSLQK